MISPLSLSNNRDLFFRQFESIPITATNPNRPPGGRPPKLCDQEIIAGLAWHVMQSGGTLANHIEAITGMHVSESALSERRQSLGTAPWLDALDVFLKPIADHSLHPKAFYRGLRLVGVDGTTFNVANTPPMNATAKKTKSRRGKSSFFRIGCAAAIELGTHGPLALRIGQNGESEAVLAAQVMVCFNEEDLLIGDRYYGNGKCAARMLKMPNGPNFLLRVQERLKAQTIRCLADGSRLVKVLDPESGEFITLREIKAKVCRSGKPWVKVRFWTNLLDSEHYPAIEMVPLYALRWEEEIAFYEIKMHLHGKNLLLSHTGITAAQEICALFMAQAVITTIRADAAYKHDIPIMQVSFARTLNVCRNLCWLLAIAKGVLSPKQLRKIVELTYDQLARNKSQPRRKRSCPRKVRQPVNKWPRLMKNNYDKGEFEYEIRHS
jgi:hypothetical protein